MWVNDSINGTRPSPPFGYFSLFITLFFLTPVFCFNILLLVATVIEKTIPPTIRLILTNIIAASEVVIVGLAGILLQAVILSGLHYLSPSDFACRLMYVILISGGAARLVLMAMFAVTAYILVRFGAAKLYFIPACAASVAVWIFVFCPNCVLFSHIFMRITFLDGDDCAAHGQGTTTIVYTFAYILVYVAFSFVISIVFPIITVVYIRNHTISDNSHMLHGMIKFAFLLLLGNIMNAIGISIPILFATFAPSGQMYYVLVKAFNYTEGVFILLSLIPTPIILLAFFKPIRLRLLYLVCICHSTGEEKSLPKASSTAGTIEGTL
jgi:hypothetical protein